MIPNQRQIQFKYFDSGMIDVVLSVRNISEYNEE